MLRNAVIAVGGFLLGIGLFALVTGAWPPAFAAAIWGVLILLGTVWERFRYKPLETSRPGAGFVATGERFIDDETGKPVRVYVAPVSGERRYVQE